MMNSKFPNTRILKLEEIAAWWLPKQMKFDVKKDSINALLPSLQRGFVWKSSQIEFLWDSIAQGFPIGSLSLAEYTEGSPAKGFGSDGEIKNPTHYLLDGQQRATAIAMGFRDIWAEESIDGERKATETLWLDLVLLDKNERCFSFRVVTKAHPWGYQRTKPDKRISSEKARNALKAFRILNTASNTKSKEYIKPHELSLKHIFPWDAEAPIPVPLLIKAIKEGNGELNKVSKCLLALLEKVDFWNSREKYDEDAKRKFEKVKSILETPNDSGFERIVTGINEALKNTEVPAPILRHIKFSPDIKTQSNEDSDDHHVVFNLFKRINTGGTALSREDINYSMLKSIWPGAPEIIEEKLLKEGMIAQPPRLVSLMSRLVLMINNDDLNKGLQPELSISQFESHLREEFKDELQTYCETKGEDLLKSVWSLLTDNENSLPKTLAAQISQHSDDLMLLLMYWVHLLKENNQYECLSENTKKRTLGFFTAIAWFANDPKKSAAHLSKKLIEKNKQGTDLSDFFNSEQYSELLRLDKHNAINAMPLLSPQKLKDKIFNHLVEQLNLMKPLTKEIVNKSNLWQTYIWDGKETGLYYSSSISDEFSSRIFGVSENKNSIETNKLWWRFFHRIYNDRRILLYAQRTYIEKWFSWFDPTQPDQIRDHNRPWDYDHILPDSWSRDGRGAHKDLPQLVRDWVNSNGNMRAWPLEKNRSKRDDKIIESEVSDYDLKNEEAVLKASFIKNGEKWDKLNKVNKKTFLEPGPHWITFIEASIDRTVDIYDEWYKELRIDELMKSS